MVSGYFCILNFNIISPKHIQTLQQIVSGMSGGSRIRRCHITCRVESIDAMRDIISCSEFIASNGKKIPVHGMKAAYNAQTEEARIYAEFERAYEGTIEENMAKMGAKSIIIDSFPSDNWETAAGIALGSVIECGQKIGYSLFRHGAEPTVRANHTGYSATGRGGGEVPSGVQSDDDDEEPPPHDQVLVTATMPGESASGRGSLEKEEGWCRWMP